MNNVKDIAHVAIHGWMVSRLGLQGKDLLCYAIIYGFSQDCESCFSGSRAYLAEWMGCTLPTVDASIKRLVDCDLVEKESITKNGVIFNSYRATPLDENFIPYKTILHPYKMALHDNNSNNTCNNVIKEENKIKKEKNNRQKTEYTKDFEEAFIAADRKGSKKNAYKRWQSLSDEDREKAVKHIPFYYKSNDRQYLKDFEGYLNGRYFDNVVYDKKGNLLYDPERQTSNVYRPQQSFELRWNDYYNAYIYIGMDTKHIPDGYTDEDRPDGASIMLNNGRGTIVWNSNTKKWEKKQ